MHEAQSAVHPVFGPVLAAIQTTPRLAAYRYALKQHDWEHDHSDDAWVAIRGRAELRRLLAEAEVVDPDFAIWNSLCHRDHRRACGVAS